MTHTETGWGTTTFASYVGRVGALAVALGIGGAIAALAPAAWADDTGTSTSRGASGAKAPSTGGPKRVAAATPKKAPTRITAAKPAPRRPGPTAPLESPAAWAVFAWARRQSGEPTVTRGTTVAHSAVAADDHHDGLPEDLERTVLADGLNEPTDFRFLPDGTILIGEKSGAIKVYQNGQLTATPLITLTTRTEVERGLAGIEIDPEFETNHYLYVSYTGADNHERLSRFTITGYTGDPTTQTLSAGAENVLYRVAGEAANYHQGGGIQFGPDGKLYWSLGDNFDFANSQRLNNPHGKILRLDVRNLNPDGTATAPADNPFVNTPGALPEIYAYGLRNPFRYVFTPTGELLEADVGGAAWEEINVIEAGANYGWPLAEGTCSGCAFVNPLYTYAHTGPPSFAGAISAILVYTGDALGPEYTDKVFIADYAQGWMKELRFDTQYSSFIGEQMFDNAAGSTVQLLQGPDGNIYQLTIYPGTLSMIAPAGGNRAPTATITATPSSGYSPLAVDFSASGSKDPEGAPLTYSWDFGDPNSTVDVATDEKPTWTYTANGTYTVTLTVSDGEKTDQTTQRIVVGSTAPTVTITSPVHEAHYNAGDKISFSGSATDVEDGTTLPNSAYTWTVEFHHADHIHPFADNIIGPTGSITIPTDESNVSTTWYRVILTVTDSSGLSSSTFVDVKPNLVNLTFTSTDPEAVYLIDGIPHKGTYIEQAVVGVKRILNVPSPQTTSDGTIVFGDWSDGGAQSHTVTTPGTDTTYTVVFDDASPHPAPEPFAVIRRLVNNELDSLVRLADAMHKVSSPLLGTVGGLPVAVLGAIGDAVADPAHAAAIVDELTRDVVAGLAQAAAPIVNALTDVVATTVLRTVGVGAAVTANLVPLTMAVVNVPVGIATAALDSAALVLQYVLTIDKLGVESALKYIPVALGAAVQAQTAGLETAVNDARYGLLTALSIELPPEAPDAPASDDPLAPLTAALTRTTEIAGRVKTSAGSIGSATAGGLATTVNTAGTGLQNFVTAVLTGRDIRSAGIVAWRGVERKAGVGRRGVQDSIEAVDDAL